MARKGCTGRRNSEKYCWDVNGSDTDIFRQFIENYSSFFSDWHAILERAIAYGHFNMVQYLLQYHRDRFSLSIDLLVKDRRILLCENRLRAILVVGKLHCRECDLHAGLKDFNDPEALKKAILQRHEIEYPKKD